MNPPTECTVSDVGYTVDGETYTGRLALPAGAGPFPGVLIAHEGPGLDDFQLGRPAQLAGLGYAAFALDYHGPLVPFADREAMFARLGELHSRPDTIRELARAGLQQLTDHPLVDADRIAAFGYCFGGEVVLELARSGANVALTAGFHPSLATTRPGDNANIVGEIALFIGADDPFIDAAQRAEFESAMAGSGVRYQLDVFGGVAHSFTHPGADEAGLAGIAYDAVADRRSWHTALALLEDIWPQSS